MGRVKSPVPIFVSASVAGPSLIVPVNADETLPAPTVSVTACAPLFVTLPPASMLVSTPSVSE